MSLDQNTPNNLEILFELYEQKMYRIAFAILHDMGQAEDVVMNSFEKIMRQVGVPSDPFSTEAQNLVSTVVKSCAIDQYRLNARERNSSTLFDYSDESTLLDTQSTNNPQEEFIDKQFIASLVNSLKEPYRAVIRERFLNDRSVRETAQLLGISEDNVRKRQQRALSMIKAHAERI